MLHSALDDVRAKSVDYHANLGSKSVVGTQNNMATQYECVVIEKRTAQLVVLAEDCDQPDYVKLVKALCAEHNVSLLTVPSAKTLGEWAGLCKIDSEGKARKVTGCSCVVVKDFGEEHEAYNVVLQHVKAQ
ncbi:hypothetical protein AHAS_Ahas20G0216900 [Arachis hypogaea]